MRQYLKTIIKVQQNLSLSEEKREEGGGVNVLNINLIKILVFYVNWNRSNNRTEAILVL